MAAAAGVKRLVFAHVGRPTIRAIDAGRRLSFGEVGVEGRTYTVRARRSDESQPGEGPEAGDEGIQDATGAGSPAS